MKHKQSHTRTERFDQKKIDRLAHINEIFNRTIGWSHQCMVLYEERKRLQLIISRMTKPHKSPVKYSTYAN